MSITRSRSAITLAAVAAMLAGCAGDSGPTRTESRAVESFHAIELRGAAQLDVEVGKGPALSITAGERVLQATSTTVRDGVLVVEVQERGGWFQRGPAATLSVMAPTLDSLQIGGAGNFRLKGVTGQKLDLAVQGAGNVEADGTVRTLTARIDGAGRVDLTRLVATDATVSVNGAGKLEVHATGVLNAEVNGVGSISYSGSPQKVVSAVNGVGSISPAGGK